MRAVGIEGLDVWYELYMETALRNGLYINGKSYFRSVFASKMECPDKAVQVTLLVACFDDTPLAAMFLILSAHRATYLYGASSSRMYGLYKFKQGFGGDVYHQLGCWDYPLEKEKYDYFCACEMNMQGYYRN